MRVLKKAWRAVLRRPRQVEVVKNSERAERLAALLRNSAPLGAEARRAVEAIAARMELRTEPSPHQRYRTVANHFTASSSKEPKLALLQQLVGFQNSRSILEIGTAYGVSAVAMAFVEERPNIVTIDLPQAILGPENIRALGADSIECVNEDKTTALPRLAREGRRFDFVFHDGGHTGDAYVDDFQAIYGMLEPRSLYAIDDIAWDRTPEIRQLSEAQSRRTCYEGWSELVADPRVEAAIEVNGNVGILLTA